MKRGLTLGVLLAVSSALAAPGTWRGTITMFVSEYTPNWPDQEKPLKVFQQIADEYQKKYPGIKIKFSTTPVPDNDTNIRVKAAAGELFDIYWAQASSLNATLPKGVATDLSPYFKQPNPYISGNKAWQDVMNARVLAESRAPSGAVYVLSGDTVGYTIYYNKDLFKKAGIAKAPTTFTELVAAAKKLRAAGINPFVQVPSYPWWGKHFLSDLYSKDYARIAGFDKAPGISALDEAVAVQKGLLSPKDPRFMSWWPTMKSFTDTWQKDYLAQDVGKNYDVFQDFVGGKAAMLYEGSYQARWMKDAGVKFGVGTFNFPKLTAKDNRFATGADTSNATGGTGAFQFAVATPQSNKTLRENGKLAAVIDWMRFFGTPTNLRRLVQENGSYIMAWPAPNGAKTTFNVPNFDLDAAALTSQIGKPNRGILAADIAPNLGWVDMQRIFGQYLAGQVTLDQARSQVQALLDRSVRDYARKNKVDLSKY